MRVARAEGGLGNLFGPRVAVRGRDVGEPGAGVFERMWLKLSVKLGRKEKGAY